MVEFIQTFTDQCGGYMYLEKLIKDTVLVVSEHLPYIKATVSHSDGKGITFRSG